MLTWALAHHTARPPSADKAGSDPTQDILRCSNARGQSNCGGRGDGGQGTSCDETHEIQGFSSLFAFSCNLPSDHVLISYKLSMLLTHSKIIHWLSSKATGLRLFHAFRQYAQRWGPMIMKSPDRVLVTWSDRDRPVVLEADLEINVQLCKEAIMTCCETAFGIDGKEFPNLADFEAGSISLIFTPSCR